MKSKLVSIKIELPDALYQKIKTQARAQKITINTYIVTALKWYLQNHPA